ncbi:hypothetical protein HYX18_04940 [Candidatus Woesearchaeota archaeon]|nr:hypothetical protein [Candidatus Woesearchaeota archaeon]
MILVHENLPEEASKIKKVVKEVFNIESILINANLDRFFIPIQEFNGYWSHPSEKGYELIVGLKNTVLIITPRDIYSDNKSKEDDFVFGHDESENNLMIVSTARMKRHDNQPSNSLEVPLDLYLKRIVYTSVHELGHSIVRADHYKEAIWVNARTGHQLKLGEHCTDNTCVMYEIVDIKAPPLSEGYMLLGEEKKFDTGMDESLKRLNQDWFCDICRKAFKIDNMYKQK